LDDRLSVSSAERVAKAIGQPGWFMPDFRFSETQIGDLVNALFAEGRKGDDRRKEPSIVIHFEADGRSEEPRFVERCGPCHKILSQRYGAMGKGDIGPNLSGLFTEHYPWTFKEHERWSPENLSEWLKNPRRIRPPAMMQPVILKAEEMIELCGVIALEAGETAPHPP
jgi:cytochrome c2